jgi:O-antigen/teichoic acid export membrane protein/GT2 family glycosyltransferase
VSVRTRTAPEQVAAALDQLDHSVVVVSRGPSLALARLLRSLGRARGIEHAELILGLDGASAEERQLVEAAVERWVPTAATVISLPNAYPGDNRNALVALATGETIAFLDDDVVVPERFLDGARSALSDPEVGVAGGPNLTPLHSPTLERISGSVLASAVATGPVRHRYSPWRPGRASELSLTLCNLVVRRELLTSAPFDSHLRCAEENDLLIRMAQDGVRMDYSPQLAVYHQRRGSFPGYARQMFKYGFGRGQLLTRAFYAKQTTYLLPILALLLLVVGLLRVPYVALAAVALYGLVIAVTGLRIGGIRHGPLATGLIAATHIGYTSGLVAGLGHEAQRLQGKVLEASRGRFGRDAALTFAAFGLAIVGGIASSVVIARALGPGGRGSFELVRTVSSIVAISAGLGLGRAAVHLRSRRTVTDAQLFGAVCSSLVTGAGVAVVAGLFVDATGLLSPGEPSLWLMCASIPLMTFFLNGQVALVGLGRGAWFRRTLGLRDPLFFVLVLAALAVNPTIEVALLAWIVHWVVSAVAMTALLYRQCGRPRFPVLAEWSRLGKAGAPPLLLALTVQAHLRLDIIALDLLRGPAAVGHYAVAVGMAESIAYGGIALAVVLYPRSMMGITSRAAVRTARSARTVFAASVLSACVLWVVGPRLLTLLFGQEFAASGAALRALLPGVVGMAVFFVLASDLAGRGKLMTVAMICAAAAAANLLLNLLLDPHFGATGAGLASTLSYWASAIAALAAFAQATGVPIARCVIPRRRDARAVAAGFLGRRRDAL